MEAGVDKGSGHGQLVTGQTAIDAGEFVSMCVRLISH